MQSGNGNGVFNYKAFHQTDAIRELFIEELASPAYEVSGAGITPSLSKQPKAAHF